jgi:hypothetical protein
MRRHLVPTALLIGLNFLWAAAPADAQQGAAVAAKSGLDPNVWFGNVEHGAASVVGRETVDYVANIYVYYVAYRLAVERDAMRKKVTKEIPLADKSATSDIP